MPKITVHPHHELVPQTTEIFAEPGQSICHALLENGIDIEHACEMSNACTTCHIYIHKGFNELPESDEIEDDLLDKAWGLKMNSRLSCQAIVGDIDLEIEIPKYTINQVSEHN